MPVLNEEARIAQRLSELTSMRGVGEVRVVDGGSDDETVAIARGFPEATVLSAGRGRARQMNAGAQGASGEVLLFLHADVTLPPDAPEQVERTLSAPGVVAGAFKTWTVPDAGPTRLAPLLHLADLRSRYSRLPYGDQALFVRADAFRAVGGYPNQPLMEDLELSRRLSRIGRIGLSDARVRVSGRRFLSRPLFYFAAINLFPALYRAGVSPEALMRFYPNVR